MRDPARIPEMINLLRAAWQETPDMRLTQLIINVAGGMDPYYMEDDVLLDALKEWIETSKTWTSR